MRVKPRFLIGAGLIVVAVLYLIGLGIRSTSEYYLTVDEAQARQGQLLGQAVRIAGRVAAASVSWDPATLTLGFAIEPIPAAGERIQSAVAVSQPRFRVVCKGQPKPDMFAEGRDVIVEGRLSRPGFVTAEQVMTSCPSKYSAKKAS